MEQTKCEKCGSSDIGQGTLDGYAAMQSKNTLLGSGIIADTVSYTHLDVYKRQISPNILVIANFKSLTLYLLIGISFPFILKVLPFIDSTNFKFTI